MASKFMVNAAFDARLLLRPSRQPTVLSGAVNKLKCLTPGRPTLLSILSSRSYSDSTSIPPFPNSSRSTEGSQPSGPKDKNWFTPKVKKQVSITLKGWGGVLFTSGIGVVGYITKELWLPDWYKDRRRRAHESARESAMYDKLKKGPVFREEIEYTIPRKPLVEEIMKLIAPAEKSRLYPLVIGEHGTGKTSLIKLAVNGMEEPKGVVYVDIALRCSSEVDVAKEMQKALEWKPDQYIDSSEPACLDEVLQIFSHLAIKYKQEYGKIPVLIIDNANRLAQKRPELLDLLQDYAKLAADERTAAVVFVSSEGRVPRRMTERSSWSRKGVLIEIGDVSKGEALQYLKLRNINGEQAAQIYELVGGRLIHLKYIADQIERDSTFEVLRQTMFADAEIHLDSAEMLPKGRYHKEGAVVLRELLKEGSISRRTFYNLVSRDARNKLLEANVFAFHFNSQEITFQSTVMKRFCEENSTLWEGNG